MSQMVSPGDPAAWWAGPDKRLLEQSNLKLSTKDALIDARACSKTERCYRKFTWVFDSAGRSPRYGAARAPNRASKRVLQSDLDRIE